MRVLAENSGGIIQLLGYRSYGDLPDTYATADLYWQPSLREPWGLAINEAMAAGLPILVSRRCGCHEDLVTPETGWTFEPDDVTDMVMALDEAATCRTVWSAMGKAAARHIAAWDLDRYVAGALAAARYAIRGQQVDRASSRE